MNNEYEMVRNVDTKGSAKGMKALKLVLGGKKIENNRERREESMNLKTKLKT